MLNVINKEIIRLPSSLQSTQKLFCRTFKESEVRNQKLRTDLYEKMVNLDAKEPTDQENTDRAITKLRYMTVSTSLIKRILTEP